MKLSCFAFVCRKNGEEHSFRVEILSFYEVFHEKVAKVAERFQYLLGSELPFSPFRAWAGYGFLDPKKQQLSLAFGTSSAAWGRAL